MDKRKKHAAKGCLWLLAALLLPLLLLPAGGLGETRVMAVSDLHYLAPELYEGSDLFLRVLRNGDGKIPQYGEELLDALERTVLREKPDALLVSGGEKGHAGSRADGTYWKALSWPGITPTSIDVDDAGHVIIASDVTADMDWNTYELLSGTELKVYYATDVNETPKEIILPNALYGTVGGFRARGDLATKGAITGLAGGASYWFGYDIADFKAVSNYYGTQNSGPGAGPNTFWTPETAAAVSVGPDLHDGVLFRGYDGAESLYYRKDAYTPSWAVGDAYEPWTLLTNAGAGGNENQNNMDIIDYKGKRIVAYTQGFHFDYSSNATIYVLDVTDITDVKPLVTINPQEDIEMTSAFTGANSADVLLHATDDALELYVVNSGRSLIGKYKIVF